MNQTIEVNIADILLRIEAKIEKLDDKSDQISKELSDFKTDIKTDISRLDEKVTGVSKRLDNLALARFLFPNVNL